MSVLTGPDDVVDTAGHLTRAYGASGRTLVLIRPDGYIAMISDAGDVKEVAKHLTLLGQGRLPLTTPSGRDDRPHAPDHPTVT